MGAYHSRTHKHADDLPLVWFEQGSHILIDAGRYGYLERTQPDSTLWQEGFWYGHPARVYCESTHSHNTVEIDGTSFDRRVEKPYGSAIVRAGRSGEIFFAEGHVRHQKSVRHSRTMVLLPRRWLLVADWLGDSKDVEHSFTQWWHFAEGSQILPLDEGLWQIAVPGLPKPLFVRSVSSHQLTSSVHVGETEPRLQGWWSPSDESLRPAAALGIKASQNQSTLSMLTLFSLEGAPAVSDSRISASGRSVRLDWEDSSFMNSLVIGRPSQPDKPMDLRHVTRELPAASAS
jgi:hypothetical protein